MGERKVISKHYPIDFDPAKLIRRKNLKTQVTVRVMLPMSIRCTTCGEFIYRGKKFNARKETVTGEVYIGIKIFRFYIRCTRCSNEITFKTDPKNSDYKAEIGAVRINNFLQENEVILEKMKQIRLDAEGDVLKTLENKTNASKMELEILDALDEIRSVNALHARISADRLLEYHLECMKQADADMQKTDIELDPDEEEILDMLVLKAAGLYIKRIDDSEDNNDDNNAKKDREMDAKRKKAVDSLGIRFWNIGDVTSNANEPSTDSTTNTNVVVLKQANNKPKIQIRVTEKK